MNAQRKSNAFLLSALLLVVPVCGDEAVLQQAMRDELARTIEQLGVEDLEKPYFVSYTIEDIEELAAMASFGALLPSDAWRVRTLALEIRVGEPAFDNTNYRERYSSSFRRRASLPLENNYQELRRALWLATDRAYKEALENLAKKRAALQNQTRGEDVADFSAVAPFVFETAPPDPLPSLRTVETFVRALSAPFTKMPEIAESRVDARLRNRRIHYLNSEGSANSRSESHAAVYVRARTQAVDGTVLEDFVVGRGRAWADVASQDLLGQVVELGERMAARRAASPMERYTGPVLLEGQAAAELLAQVFVPRLLGERTPETNAQYRALFSQSRNPFLDKLGARVLPRSLGIRDDPTLDEYAGGRLLGGYRVDEDGVPAAATNLVEAGILRALLTTRNPVPGMAVSTGNRRANRPVPSNLLLTSAAGSDAQEMRAEFMQLVDEYGLDYGVVVRRLGNRSMKMPSAGLPYSFGESEKVESANLAFKVFPDGREELIRKAELVAVSDAAFKDIVAVSATRTAYTYDHARDGITVPLRSSAPWVTISTPDLLFEELTMRRPVGNVPRPPFTAHPVFDDQDR